MENEGKGKKKIVQNKNATSKTYLISANVRIPIRLISDFKHRIYGYGCSLYRSQRDRVSILPRSRIPDSCFQFFTNFFFTNACLQFLMRSCMNFKKIDFINQCFQEQLMLGGYKCGWWKLVRDNDEKKCKFSNEFKKSFFLFSFVNREKWISFFLSFPRTTHCS